MKVGNLGRDKRRFSIKKGTLLSGGGEFFAAPLSDESAQL